MLGVESVALLLRVWSFGVWGFGVWGLGFGVWGLGFGANRHRANEIKNQEEACRGHHEKHP